jgi:hypothetical protein
MLWVYAGIGVDLQCIVAITGILKKAVIWIQNFSRKIEKPVSKTRKIL